MGDLNKTVNPDGSPRPVSPPTTYIADTAQVSDTARVYGNARIADTARVYGNARIADTAQVYGNAQVSGTARVYGNARIADTAQVYGNARIAQSQHVVTGYVAADLTADIAASVMAQTGLVVQPDGHIIAAKWVNTTAPGIYQSIHDPEFQYRDGTTVTVDNPDTNPLTACGSGLHVSHPTYWSDGDTLIAVRFHLDDVLACQEGKVRVSRLTVLGEIGQG